MVCAVMHMYCMCVCIYNYWQIQYRAYCLRELIFAFYSKFQVCESNVFPVVPPLYFCFVFVFTKLISLIFIIFRDKI